MIAVFILQKRNDLRSVNERGEFSTSDNDTTKSKCLKEIDLYSKSDYLKNGVNARPIKTVHFYYTYELCKGINKDASQGKLTLKKVWFTYNGNNKGIKNPYLFFYNSNNPTYTNTAYDRWGNYKNPLQNPGSTSSDIITNAEYPYALQDSALANSNAAAWTMDSVILPSSGSIKVGYESDDYAYVQNKRAMQMFNVVGLSHDVPSSFYSSSASVNNVSNQLYDKRFSSYGSPDNLFVSIRVSSPVHSAKEVYQKYLEGFTKIYFKLNVQMPTDQWGSGYEYIPVYSDFDMNSVADSSKFGVLSGHNDIIWVKLKGIDISGEGDGYYSSLAKVAIQFLRLNLPSKAYPGSEIGDQLDLAAAVKMIRALGANIVHAFSSFDATARDNGWAIRVDTARTYARLNNPIYKKYGGGLRVKYIKIYDNWKNMTGVQNQAVYGQIYSYTTIKNIDGVDTTISSGVASWEPMMGEEENPFRLPLEYIDKVAPLAPVAMGYTELPLGETFFPAPSVGYSQVRVRSIHSTNVKSATGYEETRFYTSYDFPVITDNSMFTPDTKKRYKTSLSDFLRIKSYHYLSMSQGFKVELNDMNGKIKSQASYPETDSIHPIASSTYYYHVDDQNAEVKHLNNTVKAVDQTGLIDTTATIGKDIELMMDMREQHSVTQGVDHEINVDVMLIGVFPAPIPSYIPMPQREETRFQSVATTKVIQRFGILDSVVAVDKGSKVSTDNLLYDNETGDVLLTRTRNEFNDTLYNFTYPAHWVYSGMGAAYQNIDAVFQSDNISNIKITDGVLRPNSKYPAMLSQIESGDELLAEGNFKNGVDSSQDCVKQGSCPEPTYSETADTTRIWAVDAKRINPSSTLGIVFIDRDGNPFTGDNLRLKIIRSGHRNLSMTPVGGITMLNSPIRIVNSKLQLVIDSNKNVVSTAAASFHETWKIGDARKSVHLSYNCTCGPLKALFDYLIASQRLFIQQSDGITVDSIVRAANNAGHPVNINDCELLSENRSGLFYALPIQTYPYSYEAKLGASEIKITSDDGGSINFYALKSKNCGADNKVYYIDTTNILKRYHLHNGTAYNIGYNFSGCSGPKGDGGYSLNANGDTCIMAIPGQILSYGPLTIDTTEGTCSDSTYLCDNRIIYLKIQSCDSCPDFTCIDPILDTTFNPYVYGVLGNWRSDRSYVYYGQRRESNTSNKTNIRANGVIQNFMPYWSLGTTYLMPTTDTSTYVWNAKSTLYNRKGFEIENADPLGRYNAGAYGYNESLPIDVVQNSQYKDQFFDGFEDYQYSTQSCSQNCPVPRNIDFVVGGGNLYDSTTHSGKYSLEINGLDSSTLKFPITVSPYIDSQKIIILRDTTGTDTIVSPIGTGLLPSPIDSPHYSSYAGFIQANKSGYYVITSTIKHGLKGMGGIEGYELGVGTVYGAVNNSVDNTVSITVLLLAGQKVNMHVDCHSGSYFTGPLDLKWQSSCLGLEEIPIENLYSANNSDNSVTYGPPLCRNFLGIKTDSSSLLPSFKPTQGSRMVFSAWVKEKKDCMCQAYDSNRVTFRFARSSHPDTVLSLKPNGNIIEGWQQYDTVIAVPADATSMQIALKSTGHSPVYFDDIRMHPYNANMKSFVYDPISLRLMAELDENNYGTFYEYDDDGTLIRVKKETERGVQTIKETRSSLSKLNDQ
jgi:hypothetical protein